MDCKSRVIKTSRPGPPKRWMNNLFVQVLTLCVDNKVHRTILPWLKKKTESKLWAMSSVQHWSSPLRPYLICIRRLFYLHERKMSLINHAQSSTIYLFPSQNKSLDWFYFWFTLQLSKVENTFRSTMNEKTSIKNMCPLRINSVQFRPVVLTAIRRFVRY